MAFTPRLNSDGTSRNNPLIYYTEGQSTDGNPYVTSAYDEGNCTWYAFGRFWECGTPPTRPTNKLGYVNGVYTDAYLWWGASDGYQRGQTPKLGAVVCYSGGNYSGLGHVAVVEEINPDGTIVVSESGWDAYRWRLRTADPNNIYPYSNPTDGYTFQGFIYNPYVEGGAPPEPDNWITGNRYLDRSEMDNNAIKFYYTMSRLGFSYNAILGMLANIQSESTINPAIWESLTPYGGGYGLVQWTPYTKYSDWAGSGWEANGQRECERIDYEAQLGLQWFSNPSAPDIGYPISPPVTFLEFKTSNADPTTLADYWTLYYEHPREDLLPSRQQENIINVDYYNRLLGGGSPTPPSKHIKWWLAYTILRRRKNANRNSRFTLALRNRKSIQRWKTPISATR